MAFSFKKLWEGLQIVPKTVSASDSQGDIEVLSTDGKIRYHDGVINSPLVTEANLNVLLDLKADKNSPALTGIPTAPTAAPLDNSTQIANTEYVDTAIAQGGGISLLAKGSVITSSGVSNGELLVGSDGQIIVADSTQSLGIKWAAAPSGGADATISVKGVLKLTNDLGGTADLPTVPELLNKIDKSTVIAKGDILVASSASNPTRLPVGTDNFVLTADSSQPNGIRWSASSGGMSNPMTTIGDIIIGSTAGAPSRLPIGTNSQILTSNGTTVTWQTPVSTANSSSAIVALNIDWSAATAFYKTVTTNSTFTFSNLIEGKTITVAIVNNTASTYTLTFPTTKKETGGVEPSLTGNVTNIYVFTRINGITYGSSIAGVV